MEQGNSWGDALRGLLGPGAKARAEQRVTQQLSFAGADHLKLANAMVDITFGTVVHDAAVIADGDEGAMFAMLYSGLYGAAANSPAAMAATFSAALIMLHESGRQVDLDAAVDYVHEHARKHGLPTPPTMPEPEPEQSG